MRGWESREAGGRTETGKAFRDEPVQPSSPGILYPLTRIPAPLAGPGGHPESKEASACLGAARSDLAKISHSEIQTRSRQDPLRTGCSQKRGRREVKRQPWRAVRSAWLSRERREVGCPGR